MSSLIRRTPPTNGNTVPSFPYKKLTKWGMWRSRLLLGPWFYKKVLWNSWNLCGSIVPERMWRGKLGSIMPKNQTVEFSQLFRTSTRKLMKLRMGSCNFLMSNQPLEVLIAGMLLMTSLLNSHPINSWKRLKNVKTTLKWTSNLGFMTVPDIDYKRG